MNLPHAVKVSVTPQKKLCVKGKKNWFFKKDLELWENVKILKKKLIREKATADSGWGKQVMICEKKKYWSTCYVSTSSYNEDLSK